VVWAHNSHLGDARATEMSARGELNLFHESQVERFVLPLHDGRVRDVLMTPRLERAIGVIYRPQAERLSHYFQARLPDQFDAIIHFDVTSALVPLERWARVEPDLPETYPTGV
jgi:erythromycin esterase-like protein